MLQFFFLGGGALFIRLSQIGESSPVCTHQAYREHEGNLPWEYAEMSIFTLRLLYPRDRTPCIQREGSWVGSIAGNLTEKSLDSDWDVLCIHFTTAKCWARKHTDKGMLREDK
jgi:hypothetical protein